MAKLIDEKLTFSLAPVGLEKVDKVGGSSVYSSDKLKNTFIEAIESQKILKPVIKKIESLINSKVIVPCYTQKNILNVLLKKAFANAIDNETLGYYAPEKKRIYILFDSNVKYFMWVDNKVVSEVVIHELMHFSAIESPSKFYGVFKSEYEKYYRKFLQLYLNINTSNLKVLDIVMFCVKEFESKIKFNKKSIFKLAKVYNKVLKSIMPDDQQRNNVIVNILSVVKIYLLNQDVFISNMERKDPKTIKLLLSLYMAYKEIGIKNPQTLPIQELIFPSEIIAMQTSQKISSKHYMAIKSIK